MRKLGFVGIFDIEVEKKYECDKADLTTVHAGVEFLIAIHIFQASNEKKKKKKKKV